MNVKVDWKRPSPSPAHNYFAALAHTLRIERILGGCPRALRMSACSPNQMPTRPTIIHRYAPPNLRDQFLLAIDCSDSVSSTELATNLIGCTNPLPSMTCAALQLPIGSTYGAAALRVLQLVESVRVDATNAAGTSEPVNIATQTAMAIPAETG